MARGIVVYNDRGWSTFIELTDSLWPELLARDELIASDWLPISASRWKKPIATVFISNNSL